VLSYNLKVTYILNLLLQPLDIASPYDASNSALAVAVRPWAGQRARQADILGRGEYA